MGALVFNLRLAQSKNRRVLAGFFLVIALFSWLFFGIRHTGTFLYPALMWTILGLVVLFAPERVPDHPHTAASGPVGQQVDGSDPFRPPAD